MSPPDWVFYPLVALALAGLIWGAMSYRPNAAQAVVTDRVFLLEGQALAQLIPGPGTRMTFLPSGYGVPVARVSASATLEAAGGLSAGVGAFIPREFEDAVIAKRIKVEVLAQALGQDQVELAIGYFTTGNGDSGWQTRTVGNVPQNVSFEWQVPEGDANDNESVGVWPDVSGQGQGVLIQRIRIEILD